MLDQPAGLRFLILQTDCHHAGRSSHAARTTNDTTNAGGGGGGARDDGDVLLRDSTSDTTALPPPPPWHQAWVEFLAEAPLICDLVLVEDGLHGANSGSQGSADSTAPNGQASVAGLGVVSLLPQMVLRGCGRSNVLSLNVDVGGGSGGSGIYQVGASSCHVAHRGHRFPLVVQSPTWIWDASNPSATATVDLDASAAQAEFHVHWEQRQSQTSARETVPSELPDFTWISDQATTATDIAATGGSSSTNATPSFPSVVDPSSTFSSSSASRHNDDPASLWLQTVQASLERELLFTHRALTILGVLLVSLLAALLWDVWTASASPSRGRHHRKTTATTAAGIVPASSSCPPNTTNKSARNHRPPPSTIRCAAPSGGEFGNVSPLSLDPALGIGGRGGGAGRPTPEPAWSPYRKLKEDWELRVQAKRRESAVAAASAEVAEAAAAGQAPAPAQPRAKETADRSKFHPGPLPPPTRRIIRRLPAPTPLPPPPRSPQGYRTPPRPLQATSTDPRGAALSPAIVTPLPYEAGSSFLDEFWGD